eukprot:1678375-Rhodomonas_salina.1
MPPLLHSVLRACTARAATRWSMQYNAPPCSLAPSPPSLSLSSFPRPPPTSLGTEIAYAAAVLLCDVRYYIGSTEVALLYGVRYWDSVCCTVCGTEVAYARASSQGRAPTPSLPTDVMAAAGLTPPVVGCDDFGAISGGDARVLFVWENAALYSSKGAMYGGSTNVRCRGRSAGARAVQ